MKLFIFYVFITIFIFTTVSYSQLNYKFKLETGLLINSIESLESKSKNISKLLGSINYKVKHKRSESSIALKIRPELFSNDFLSIKYGAKGNYTYYKNNLIWKTIISYQYFNYTITNNNSYYNLFSIVNGASFNIAKTIPIQLFLGYSYQNNVFTNNINSDFIYLDTKIKNSITNYFSISYGVFIENFTTEKISSYDPSNIKTSGWYLGPQIKLHYLKEILLNMEYKILPLFSKNTLFPSLEHRISTLCGIIFNKYTSLFFLIDYYINSIKWKSLTNNTNFLLPTKNENSISLKFNYKLGSKLSVFLKSGYYKENLVMDNKKLEGMNFLIGIELKN